MWVEMDAAHEHFTGESLRRADEDWAQLDPGIRARVGMVGTAGLEPATSCV
jgi:hypothetical protein